MKFLCDQCKAKYQIADEKVAGGKTLKMKCRKCGHIIEIRASNAVAGSIPPPAGGVGDTVQLSALSDEAAAKIESAISAPKPPEPKPAAPPRATPKTAATGTRPEPATSSKPSGAASSGAASAGKPAVGIPRPGADKEKKEPEKKESALASAFSKVATKKPEAEPVAPSPAVADPPAEEWYVAIDDVPVGPIRLSELRSKYNSGAVHDDSLCWREGYEEWRPLRSLQELHRLVKEEVSGAQGLPRNSILPGAGVSSSRSREQQRSAPGSGKASPSTPARAAAAAPVTSAPVRGNVIPFSRQTGVAARKLEEDEFGEDAPTRMHSAVTLPEPADSKGLAADPFAAPKPTEPLPSLGGDASKAAPLAVGLAPSAHPERLTMTESLDAWRQKRGLSTGLVLIIGASCLLAGVVIAVFAISKREPQVIEKRVEVAGPEKTVIVERNGPAPSVSAPVASASASTADSSKIAWKGPAGPTGPAAPAPSGSAPGSSKINNLLGGPDLPSGPDLPGAAAGGGGGKPKPEGGDWNSCAMGKKHAVQKFCYDEGVGTGSASARVNLCVNPDGSVSSANVESSAPNASFGSCVARQLKSCKLPATAQGGCAAIPYIFGG